MMSDGNGQDRQPLKRLVIAVPLTEAQLRRLRDHFPDLEIVATTPEDLASALPDAAAVVAWNLSLDQLALAPKLRWLQVGGAGVDGVPLADFAAREVVLTNNSGVHAANIAEHLMAMMLAFARQFPSLMRGQLAREWRDAATRPDVFELSTQTLVVVGLGDIGLALAERAAAFGMRVIGTRRRPDQAVPSSVSRVVGNDRLAEVLPEADHVAICLPLTAGTRNLFDAPMLALMKPTAYLYNIGRGPIVNTAALVDALTNDRLGGAGLDVTDPEPLPPDSPLWAMANVLITMHTSGATPHYWDRALDLLIPNIERFQRGEPLHNRVDSDQGY